MTFCLANICSCIIMSGIKKSDAFTHSFTLVNFENFILGYQERVIATIGIKVDQAKVAFRYHHDPMRH